MADNVTLNTGTGGETLATDDIAGIQHQRVKIQHGADGSATDVSAASPLPVDLGANNDVTLATLPDTAGGDLAAQTVDLAAMEVLLTTIESNQLPDGHNVTVDNASIAVTGTFWQVTQPISGTITANAGTNLNTSTLALESGGNLATIAGDTTSLDSKVTACNTGAVTISAALPVGTNAIGKLSANSGVDIGDVDVLSVAAGSNLIGDVGIQGRTTGGLTPFYDSDLDETAVVVKAAAGTVYAIQAFNTTAAPLFLQLFNVAQGSVTVGTTTPTQQFVIPGNADSDGAGFTFNVPQGIAYGTAITAACSTNSEGNGAPGAGACIVNIEYK